MGAPSVPVEKKKHKYKYIHILDTLYDEMIKYREIRSKEKNVGPLSWAQLFNLILEEFYRSRQPLIPPASKQKQSELGKRA
jgi:hypothetical protein